MMIENNRILEDAEGGALLRSVERWLYQPYSHILTSEVSKVLAPYFDIPAPLESKDSDQSNLEESHSEDAEDADHEAEEDDADAPTNTEEDESDHVRPAREKQPTVADNAESAPKSLNRGEQGQTKKQA